MPGRRASATCAEAPGSFQRCHGKESKRAWVGIFSYLNAAHEAQTRRDEGAGAHSQRKFCYTITQIYT